MGFMRNVQVAQAGQANKLAKKQLKELQRQSTPSQPFRPPTPVAPQPVVAQAINDDLTAEIRQLNEDVRAIAANLDRLVEIFDVKDRSQP